MRASIAFIAFGLLATSPARAQSVSPPHVVAGDTWTYVVTTEDRGGWRQNRAQSTVERASATSIAVETRVVGSTMPPSERLMGADWSRMRSVNGHETVVNRPLTFPLAPGRSWTVEYVEDHPNREHATERFRSPYKVLGWEDVTVPAGTFHALKIEAEGEWSATLAPAVGSVSGARVDAQGSTTLVQTNRVTAATATGRTYKGFWYAPEVKRWVKSVEEYYDANGRRTERHAEELESYRAG